MFRTSHRLPKWSSNVKRMNWTKTTSAICDDPPYLFICLQTNQPPGLKHLFCRDTRVKLHPPRPWQSGSNGVGTHPRAWPMLTNLCRYSVYPAILCNLSTTLVKFPHVILTLFVLERKKNSVQISNLQGIFSLPPNQFSLLCLETPSLQRSWSQECITKTSKSWSMATKRTNTAWHKKPGTDNEEGGRYLEDYPNQ